MLKVEKLGNNTALPKRSTDGAIGYDLCASQNYTIPEKGKGLVQIRLAISFLPGLYASIVPRSGLALKKFIDVGASVVDSDCISEVGVVSFNRGDHNFEAKWETELPNLF